VWAAAPPLPVRPCPPLAHHPRLRVGFLTRDARSHAVAHFLWPALAHAAPFADVVVFDDRATPASLAGDAMARRLRDDGRAHWVQLGAVRDDAAAAAVVAGARLDVLVELQGHTASSRLHVLAAAAPALAPALVSWLGYPGSTGGVTRYKLTDAHACPDDAATDAAYDETLVRLPGGTHCYAPLADVPDAKAPRDGVVFAYFGNPAKLSASCVDAFAAVLLASPGAVLSVRYSSLRKPAAAAAVVAAFEQRGVPAGRLRVGWDATLEACLAAHAGVDVALDAWPYAGESTVCAAAWMGTPTVCLAPPAAAVTCPHAARAGAAVLLRLGFPQLVAATVPQFVHVATRLAQRGAERAALSKALRPAFQRCTLGDAAAWAQGFYEALAAVAEGRHAAAARPRSAAHGPPRHRLGGGPREH
jgi:protein O-GlcNAc transferase